jgi:hypothetical protein
MKGDAAKADILIFIGNPVFTPWRLILQMPRAPCPPHEKDTPLFGSSTEAEPDSRRFFLWFENCFVLYSLM